MLYLLEVPHPALLRLQDDQVIAVVVRVFRLPAEGLKGNHPRGHPAQLFIQDLGEFLIIMYKKDVSLNHADFQVRRRSDHYLVCPQDKTINLKRLQESALWERGPHSIVQEV